MKARDARVSALLADPRLWTAHVRAALATMPTGHRALDAELPGGGWPCGALTELLHERPGIGELTLLAPALTRLSAQASRIALVNPPYRACASGWHQLGVSLEHVLLIEAPSRGDARWCAEQALRSTACGAVLLWPDAIDERELRRLQLAAEAGGALAILFRPVGAARQSSPAALRLQLAPSPRPQPLEAGLRIDILKSRGGRPRALQLALPGRGRRPFPVHSHVVAVPLSAAPAARCIG